MILIIAADIDEDMSVDLYEYLKEQQAEVAFIGQNTLPYSNTITYYPQNGKFQGHIKLNNMVNIEIAKIKAIYTRLGFSNFSKNKFNKEEKQYIEAQRQVSIDALLENTEAMVINRSKSQFLNSSKLFQSWIIQKYWFNIQNSIISNDPAKVKDFIENNKENGVIYKSCSSERSIVKKLKKEDYNNLDLVKNVPHLFQECVEGYDIRVHTLVTGQVFACKIVSNDADYRYDSERKIVPIDIPEKLAKQCVKMTADMGLYLSGVDLRVTKDEKYYCFEVNPSPAFSWYQYQTGLPITKAVGDMMINAEKYTKLVKRKY